MKSISPSPEPAVLSGRLVRLVPLARTHLDQTRRWANDLDLMRLLDRAWPVSDVEHERWFAEIPHHPDRAFFAIESTDGDRHIGNAWLWDIDRRHRRAELRIVVGERASHGHGCGTEAIDLISGYALARLGLHKVVAFVLSTNPRARRAFEKAGFELEGTLRHDRWMDDRYVDVDILAKRS